MNATPPIKAPIAKTPIEVDLKMDLLIAVLPACRVNICNVWTAAAQPVKTRAPMNALSSLIDVPQPFDPW